VIHGDPERRFQWASVTKLITAIAVLLACEEGTVRLDDAAGPPGSTVRHLLAHASGLGPDGIVPKSARPVSGYRGAIDRFRAIASPGARRIYSNVGFEVLASVVAERSGMDFSEYLREGVLEPLGMSEVKLEGSPAFGASGTIADLARLGSELLVPHLLDHSTLSEATSVAFPNIGGVLPGFGKMEPNDWGLGFEIKNSKEPHWTGRLNSPATFGHFGQSGAFVWVDPVAGVACASLSDRPFGPWAIEAWPALSDAVISASRAA
jgi:CubicO group peptidase (beta-lactamase class C family)